LGGTAAHEVAAAPATQPTSGDDVHAAGASTHSGSGGGGAGALEDLAALLTHEGCMIAAGGEFKCKETKAQGV
jgi:hypothetical protein